MKKILNIIIPIILLSCEMHEHLENPCTNIINAEFNKNSIDTIKLSEIIDSIQYIKIEASRMPVGNIKNICYCNNLYYLQDVSTHSIHIVDPYGKIVNSFCRKGRARNEYISMHQMDVHPKSGEIHIYDMISHCILVYNVSGDFLRRVEIGENVARDFAVLDNGDYLFYTPDYIKDRRRGVWQTDSNGEFKRQVIGIDEKFKYGILYPKYFRHIGEGVVGLMTGEDYDRIYHITADSLFVPYKLQTDISIPKKIRENTIANIEKLKGCAYTKLDYCETSDWMTATIDNFKKQVIIYYDKHNAKSYIVNSADNLLEDVDAYGKFEFCAEDRFMKILDPAVVLDYDYIAKQFPDITENSNPIIIVSHTKAN